MSTPALKQPEMSIQDFLDGSAAGRQGDDRPWEVVKGPDGRETDLTAACEAATFAHHQNTAMRLAVAQEMNDEQSTTHPHR